MPQPVAFVAVADQQFALALEHEDAVDLDGLDRGRSFGCVVRAVGRVVRVRLDGEHRSTPWIRVINANYSHLSVKQFHDWMTVVSVKSVDDRVDVVGCRVNKTKK